MVMEAIRRWKWMFLSHALAGLIVLLHADMAHAQDPEPAENEVVEDTETEAVAVPSATQYTLGQCLAIALERQPALRAARFSLLSAERGSAALYNLPFLAERLTTELPIRKQQALRGIVLAQSEIDKVRQETIYDVTRLYWTCVYAKQQQIIAGNIIEQLEIYYGVAKEEFDTAIFPLENLTPFSLAIFRDTIDLVGERREEARLGYAQAMAALHEVMNLENAFIFEPADTELPIMSGFTTQEDVVRIALARRPELIQAANGVDAFRLEICAQADARGYKVQTLAAGSDLHSRQVPFPRRNSEYKPGAVPPEMPTILVGRAEDRVARARALSQRQDEVYNKAVGLVRLEAANAYLEWNSTRERIVRAKKRYEDRKRLAKDAPAAAAARKDSELLIQAVALAGKAQSEYLEAVYEHIKALTTLERVTAGGIEPAFPGR